MFAPDPMYRSKAAKHAEIACRYRNHTKNNGAQPFSVTALRIAELRQLFRFRYGRVLPDNQAGREAARIMAHHLITVPTRNAGSPTGSNSIAHG
jgi:hypothetical protein